MLEIDFFADAVAYIDAHASETPSKPQQTQEHEEKAQDRIYIEPEKQPAFKPVTSPLQNKAYNINLDKEIVTLKGVTYPLPDVFNKKMIEQGDKKTIEMMFIYLGHPEVEA